MSYALRILRNWCLGKKFLLDFENLKYLRSVRTSGDGTLNFGEMERKLLTLAKRQLSRNECCGKLSKAPQMVLWKVWQGVYFHIVVFWPMSIVFFHFQHHLNTPITTYNVKSGEQLPTKHMSCWETFRITLIWSL